MKRPLAAIACAAALMGETLSPAAADSYGDASSQSPQVAQNAQTQPTARKGDEPMRVKVKNKKRKSVVTVTRVAGPSGCRRSWPISTRPRQ